MTGTVITSWESYSPFGHGAEAHARGVAGEIVPAERPGRLVPDFDVREVLGRQGVRGMDRSAGLAVATTGRLLERVRAGDAPGLQYASEDLAFVLGASDGAKSVMDFQRDTWTRSKPYDVNPADIPRTLMNFAAGKSAIWHQLRGPNTTICGSHTTSLLTLNYARRLQSNRHAKAVLWGAVEEHTAERVGVDQARYPDAAAPGEGCIMFLLEGARGAAEGGRTPKAEVLAVDFGVYLDATGLAASLADCLHRALRQAGLAPGEVSLLAPSSTIGRGAAECAAAAQVFGDVTVVTRTSAAFGDTRAVSAAFQLVEVLLTAEPGAVAAVTTSDAEGRVGCTLVRIP